MKRLLSLALEAVVNGSAVEAEFAEIEATSIGVNQMWMKIGPAAILAAFLAGTADLGYAFAADGRATDGGATSAGTGNGGAWSAAVRRRHLGRDGLLGAFARAVPAES